MKEVFQAVVFLFCIFMTSSCSVLKQGVEQLIEPPVIKVVDIQPKTVSFSGAQFLITVSIQNSNAFEISASELKCKLYADNQVLAESAYPELLSISSEETKILPLQVDVSPSLVLKVFKGWMLSKKPLDLTWSLQTRVEAFLMSLPIERRGQIVIPST